MSSESNPVKRRSSVADWSPARYRLAVIGTGAVGFLSTFGSMYLLFTSGVLS